MRADLSVLSILVLASNFRGPANAWAATNYIGATGAISVVATNGATFYVTGVKLEIGSVATPYNRQSLAKSMADCQRYYHAGHLTFSAHVATGGSGAFGYTPYLFKASMRALRRQPCKSRYSDELLDS